MSAPLDNLVRAWAAPEAAEIRAKDGTDTMVGHFAVFNQWTEINSRYEGHFLERIAPGAFDDAFKNQSRAVRVLYDHGADPQIGNKPLGTPTVLRSDDYGAYYEVDLFNSSYVNDLKPAIRSGQLGASFRFGVDEDEWNNAPARSAYNPDGVKERTILRVSPLYEFGPVTFPAYPDASAGMRSRTDEFLAHFMNDPLFVARFRERVGPAVVDQITATLPTAEGDTRTEPPTEDCATPETTADGGATDSQMRRARLFAVKTAAFDAFKQRLKENPQ